MFDTDSLIPAATASLYALERFYVSVGLTFKHSEYNCIPYKYKKIWVSHVAAGPIDLIQYLLGAPSCEKIVCDKLSEHVYDTCFASIEAMFSDGPKV